MDPMTRDARGRWRSLLAVLLLGSYLALGPGAPAARAAREQWCPREAAPYCAENAFLDYWRGVDAATGGYALDIIGYPLSPARLRPSDGRVVQFYERAILEWHPNNTREHQVQLSRLGALAIERDTTLGLRQRQAQAPLPCESTSTCATFDQTAHSLRGLFRNRWLTNGGLALYGYPLTEEFQLPASGGGSYTVQYFERNRFEAHPENADDRYKVLLGRLGAEELQRNLAEVSTWKVVGTPSYVDGGTAPPTTSVSVLVEPDAGPRGTTFVITLSGLPAGAALVSTIAYPSGATASKSYQLGPGETTAQERISTSMTSPLGTRNVTYTVDGAVVARAAYTVTAAPAAPPATAAGDAALVQAGLDLIAAVPEMRYLVDTLTSRGVTWSFRELPNAWGAYYPGQRTVVYATELRGMDPHDIGAVTGHEGQHAYDSFEYGAPTTVNGCYTLEYRGFLAAAALWKAWYGPGGKPNPLNDLERENNAILADLLYNNGDQVKKFIISAYAGECGAWLTGRTDGTGDARDIPTTAASLPPFVLATLPGAAEQLAWFAGETLTAAALPGAVPAWRLR